MIPTPDRMLLRRCAYVLDHPNDFSWTTQGFGMIRTYLDEDKRFRLNVWDKRLRVSEVSDIHDHPWDFTSWVLVGQLKNQRYVEGEQRNPKALPFQHVTITTGEGGGPIAAPRPAWLVPMEEEIYTVGSGYVQHRLEIHKTEYLDGTVTINDRSPATPEHTARIYWPSGPWVNAEPRAATKAEIYSAVEQAMYQSRLDRWSRP